MVTVLLWIVGIYLLLCIAFYFFQHFAFFRPEILPQQFVYQYPFPFEEVGFEMEDGGRINGIYFRIPNALGVVYYLKGNSRSVKGWGKFAKDFVGKGYDFFMIDYRGFGKSKGRRSENILYNDAQHVYKWLKERYAEETIVVYGRSFGSGVAARIASWNHPKMLILDSPYYSFQRLVQSLGGVILPLKLLLRYKIPSYTFLKKIDCPVYILHGKRDRIIPIWHSERLKAENPEKIRILPIEKGHHNDLPTFSEFHDHLYDVLTEAVE